jgi:hypothetical protein
MSEPMSDAERWPQDPRTPFGRFAMFLKASERWDSTMLLGSHVGGRAEIVVSIGDLRGVFDELREARAEQPRLRTEYGARVTYTDTLTAEGPIADTLDEALEALADFDAKGHATVVSRELIEREVTGWREVGSKTEQQPEDGDRG